MATGGDVPTNMAIYINNLNEKIKLEVLLLERAARLVTSALFSKDGECEWIGLLNFATDGAWMNNLLQRAAVWVKMCALLLQQASWKIGQVLAPRIGYLPLLVPQIKPFFNSALPPGLETVWFEYKGLPLKWLIQMQMILWRGGSCNLLEGNGKDGNVKQKKQGYTPYNNDVNKIAHRPSRVTKEEWRCLVYYWNDSDVKDKDDRKNPTYTFIKTHTRKGGGAVNEETSAIVHPKASRVHREMTIGNSQASPEKINLAHRSELEPTPFPRPNQQADSHHQCELGSTTATDLAMWKQAESSRDARKEQLVLPEDVSDLLDGRNVFRIEPPVID
ncbi:hypothetical protein RHMOL_Rhmol11G0044000 [Rhododendron molle]|uniref:Uncharacterized protein n=1 Tax=Rhododendron molle TaxID=49168 RepID=A0ACC0LNH4_RHOML|nr:hypothetical protein RHMOL_Rhmol11G0044000 [Rhododendron molle]